MALITGCGKPVGIGNSTARALAAAGVAVVVSDVRADRGRQRAQCRRATSTATGAGSTAWSRTSPRPAAPPRRRSATSASRPMPGAWSRRCSARYGRLDILVNNAGAPQGADRNEIEDVPVEAWDLTMGVNARGCFLMSRAAVPAMRKAQWGRIVSVSSKAAFRPGATPRDLCRLEGGDRRLHQIAGARPGAARDHRQRGLPRPDPHLAGDQHQPARIRRRPRNRLHASAPRRSRSAASAPPTRSPR